MSRLDSFRKRRTALLWVVFFLLSVALSLLPFVFRLDGKAHADWQQFLGRFHPFFVHLPVGLLLLVPVLELAGRTRPALREAATFVLGLSVFCCLLAAALGFLLAYGGGDAGSGVSRHMVSGIALTIAVSLCALLRGSSDGLRGFYPYLLACVVSLLVFTAHQGGSLTHGAQYLSEYIPASLKRLAVGGRLPARPPEFPDSFYARHIYPIFEARCVVCHGEQKVKGGLRVDSYDLLMRGGSEGAVIIPGKPERSILLQRITLPPDHKKFMPGEGKPPLKPEEIARIRAWIAQGASPQLKSLEGVAAPEEQSQKPQP
jgi:uncharacterized membrane protein